MADHRARPTVRPQKLALGVLARAPQADATPKKLCPPLSQDDAAELSRALLADLLNTLVILPMGQRSVLTVSDDEATTLRERVPVPARWQLFSADSQHLETRLNKGLDHLFSTGAEGAAIVRSDVPMMPLDEVFEGMLWLTKRRRLLLGPTNQGSFYLVGTTQREPALFQGADWSSPGVIDRIRARAEEMRIEVELLKPATELVDPNDLSRLAREIAAAPTAWGTNISQTAAVLARAGFKP